MVFCCVKDFLARRRSVNPAQAWTNSICRSMRWHVLPRLLKAEIGTFRKCRNLRHESGMRTKADAPADLPEFMDSRSSYPGSYLGTANEASLETSAL
jgi:hypothetical protein